MNRKTAIAHLRAARDRQERALRVAARCYDVNAHEVVLIREALIETDRVIKRLSPKKPR